MSLEFWFRGRLQFRDGASIDAAHTVLKEEGYADSADNLLGDDELVWDGTVLTIDARGSMPYSCFDISSGALYLYAVHAARGEVIALNVEDGLGERYTAANGDMSAENSDDLEDHEVDALIAEYGADAD